jgi:quercetin dioxygenase-like cupin family protein
VIPYRVDFGAVEWKSPIPGVRHKAFRGESMMLRMVEYSREVEPHWCERSHIGVILYGEFEIEFESCRHVFRAGDGVFIPAGEAHRHRATALTDVVRAVFVEEA